MALHLVASEDLKRIDSQPVVTYASDPYVHTLPDGSKKELYYTIVRESSHDFEYVGLTMNAAVDLAAKLRGEYTKSYLAWSAEIDESDPSYPQVVITPTNKIKCTAEIKPYLIAGDDWGVQVSVVESDTIISTNKMTTAEEFEVYFQENSGRQIISGALKIFKARWSLALNGMTEVEYVSDLADFDESRIVPQYKMTGAEDSWTDVSEIISRRKGYISFGATTSNLVRLVYGDGVISNEFSPQIASEANLEIKDFEIMEGGGYVTYLKFKVQASTPTVKLNAHAVGNWSINGIGGLPLSVERVNDLASTLYELTYRNGYYIPGLTGSSISTDQVYRSGGITVSYGSADASGISQPVNPSSYRNKLAIFDSGECIGWYVDERGYRVYRFRIRVLSEINLMNETHDFHDTASQTDPTLPLVSFDLDPDDNGAYLAVIDQGRVDGFVLDAFFRMAYSINGVGKTTSAFRIEVGPDVPEIQP